MSHFSGGAQSAFYLFSCLENAKFAYDSFQSDIYTDIKVGEVGSLQTGAANGGY